MAKLDQIISEVNGDLQDCLAPVRDRFRQAMSEIFDYAIANPAQNNAATAQSAIATAFKVHYADGLVSPGITIESAITAFNNRHGVGATANLKWQSVRDFIVARNSWRARVLDWLEEGTLPSVPSLKLESIRGTIGIPLSGASDKTDVVTKDPNTGVMLNRVWESVSLGYRIKEDFANNTVVEV